MILQATLRAAEQLANHGTGSGETTEERVVQNFLHGQQQQSRQDCNDLLEVGMDMVQRNANPQVATATTPAPTPDWGNLDSDFNGIMETGGKHSH